MAAKRLSAEELATIRLLHDQEALPYIDRFWATIDALTEERDEARAERDVAVMALAICREQRDRGDDDLHDENVELLAERDVLAGALEDLLRHVQSPRVSDLEAAESALDPDQRREMARERLAKGERT